MSVTNAFVKPFEQHRFLGRLNLIASTPPNQFILYNHVTDYYYYGPDGNRKGLMFLAMRDTLVNYLQDLGYEVIVIYNPSEGRVFAKSSMEQLYKEVTSGIPQNISYGSHARSAAGSVAAPAPTSTNEPTPPTGQRPEQRPEQVIQGLGELLRQSNISADKVVPSAVIIERVHNLMSNPPLPDDRKILDQIQSWSAINNGNVSILIADTTRLEDLPLTLVGTHRSGVVMLNIGLPNQDEINQLFISAENGTLSRDFCEPRSGAPPAQERISINREQRAELKSRLSNMDDIDIRGLFRECAHRKFTELNLRTLRLVRSTSIEVWLDALTRRNLEQVGEELRNRIEGQDYAITQVIRAMAAAGDDLRAQADTGTAEEKLLAYFFFAGPTGVGKTEVFRALTDAFPQLRTRKFNMPEYKEEHSVARFFGAPPGYVGHGKGELGQFLLDNPASIVLFDEFEKAHPNVWKNFLTMLEGSLTTGDGIRVDLSQTIFIFTSNAGAADLRPIRSSMSDSEQENTRNENRGIIERSLRQSGAPPELIGRLLEAIIPFNHLSEIEVRKIIQKRLSKLTERFHVQFHISVDDYLLDVYGTQAQFGARPIAQHIDKKLKADLTDLPELTGCIYKDNGGITRQASDESQINSIYTRHSDTARSSAQKPMRIDTTSDRAFRESVSPAITAVLTYITNDETKTRQYRGSGTGFFVTGSGHLLTNRHVVEACTGIVAVFNNGQTRIDMVILGVSHFYDLAVLRPVQPMSMAMPFLPLANSGDVEVDTEIVTFGYPYLEATPAGELSFTLPERSERGHVGVRLDPERLFRLAGCGLNPGNSGGPLFTCDDGRVIGVVMAKRTDSEGMSFAIMSSVAEALLNEMGVSRPFIRIDRQPT